LEEIEAIDSVNGDVSETEVSIDTHS